MDRRLLIFLIIAGAALLLIGVASAQGRGPRGGEGPAGGDGPRGPRALPVFGEILSITDGEIVIAPALPPGVEERLAQDGREPPELPDRIVISLTDETEFFQDGRKATGGAFSEGDEVVIIPGPGTDGEPMALRVADPETAKEYLKQQGRGPGRMGQSGEMPERGDMPSRGRRMGDGEGRMSQGGPGGPPRPVFGSITAIDGDSVTVKFELPDFVLKHIEEAGGEPPGDLPESVTLALGERTRFVVAGEPVDGNPFGEGDRVAVVLRPAREGEAVAMVMSDWQSAEERMAQGPPPGGPGECAPGPGACAWE